MVPDRDDMAPAWSNLTSVLSRLADRYDLQQTAAIQYVSPVIIPTTDADALLTKVEIHSQDGPSTNGDGQVQVYTVPAGTRVLIHGVRIVTISGDRLIDQLAMHDTSGGPRLIVEERTASNAPWYWSPNSPWPMDSLDTIDIAYDGGTNATIYRATVAVTSQDAF